MSKNIQTTPNEIKRSTYFLGIAIAIYDIIVAAVDRSTPSSYTNDLTFIILGFVTVVLFNMVYMGLARGLDKKAGLFKILFIGVMIFRIFEKVLSLVNRVGLHYGVAIPKLSTLMGITLFFVVYWLLCGLPFVFMLVLFVISQKLDKVAKVFVGILLVASVVKIIVNIPGVNSSNASLAMAIIFDLGLIVWSLQGLGFIKIRSAPGPSVTITVATAAASTQPTEGTKASTIPAYAEPIGPIKGLPTLAYWCDNCNKPLTTRFQRLTKEEMGKPQKCPTCGMTLKAFWVPFDKRRYSVFVLTLTFFAATLWISMLPDAILGYLNIYAAGCVLAGTIVCAVIFILLAIYWYRTKQVISGRPANATETPSLAPLDRMGKEMLFLLIFVIGGSLAIFGIFWAICF